MYPDGLKLAALLPYNWIRAGRILAGWIKGWIKPGRISRALVGAAGRFLLLRRFVPKYCILSIKGIGSTQPHPNYSLLPLVFYTFN